MKRRQQHSLLGRPARYRLFKETGRCNRNTLGSTAATGEAWHHTNRSTCSPGLCLCKPRSCSRSARTGTTPGPYPPLYYSALAMGCCPGNHSTRDSTGGKMKAWCCTTPSTYNRDHCRGKRLSCRLPGRSGTKLAPSRSACRPGSAETAEELGCRQRNRSTLDSTPETTKAWHCTNPSTCTPDRCRGKPPS